MNCSKARIGGGFRLLIGVSLALQSIPLCLAQQTPRPVHRRLEIQTYDWTNPHGPYLGQKPPSIIPAVFAPDFISSKGGAEYTITFAPDGNEIYFSRYMPADDSDTTWVTRQHNGVWTPPARAEFATGIRDTEPFMTTDGHRMFFLSIRQGGPQSSQIFSMDRGVSGWSAPLRLGSPFSSSPKAYPTAAGNGNLYFTEETSSTSRRFLMARFANGTFATPIPLTSTINAYNLMGHAFITADESALIFDVAPTGQSYELYVSFKNGSGDWLPPIRLNNAVNAVANVTCPAISPDGKYLFFQRGGDIWWVDARIVFELKPTGEGGK